MTVKSQKPFNERAAQLRHLDSQRHPHPIDRIKRTEPRGDLAAVFVFPLDELKPRDRVRKEKSWQAKSDRQKVLRRMQSQFNYGEPLGQPLSGRPLVRCIRYSSHEPDSTSGWGKVAVDCLQPGGTRKISKRVQHPRGHMVTMTRESHYSGLGIIRNDRPADCEVVEWWEPAKRGEGFAVVEVWTGQCE